MPLNDGSDGFPSALKLLIAGGFGVGKTTFVGAVSEIEPLHTEELLTTASVGTDRLTGVEGKSTTTVAMDFGRITISPRHVLYLFGTPGQERFWFMWDELSSGAIGAVVLADTRRLEDCFPAVDFFESRGIGFVIAVNEFDATCRYGLDDLRLALDLKPDVPIVHCDARDQRSATGVLIGLIHHLLASRPVNEEHRPANDGTEPRHDLRPVRTPIAHPGGSGGARPHAPAARAWPG